MSVLANLAKQAQERRAQQTEEAKYDLSKIILTNEGPRCRKCWESAGRSLTQDCCICTGDVTFEERAVTELPIHYLIPKKKLTKKKKEK